MQVGLMDRTGGCLTAQRYGDGVTVLGSSLGPQQTWELRVCGRRGRRTVVELRGRQGQALRVDADGSVRCAPCGAPGTRFLLAAQPSGAWTLQQEERGGGGGGGFLESDGEDVFCLRRRGLAAAPPWMPRLAAHAHAALFHPGRQRYARADPELERAWVDAPEPYPEECAFALRPRCGGGVYHLETAGHRFLSRSERLLEAPSAETAFHLTLRPDGLACLTDRQGRLLYPQGRRGLLALGDRPAAHEEWFAIRRCPPWVSLRTRAGRCVAVVRELDVFAGSKKVTPMSVFNFEVNPNSKTVQLRGINHKYLVQREGKHMAANGCSGEPETNFQVLWHCGKIFLRAVNGCYLGTLPAGLVVTRALHPGPNEEFGLRLANRSFLLLRGPYGYVGSAPGHKALQCNCLEPDCIELLPCKHGVYHLQTRGKSFWSLTSKKTLRTGGKTALNFCLEIRGNNLLAILAPNGYYLRGDQEGTIMADSEEVSHESLWDF